VRRVGPIFAAVLIALAGVAALGSASASAAPNEIAFDCKTLDICLLDPDHPSTVADLTDNGETSIDEKPIWSPSGKKIAFISNFGSGGIVKNIFVMEPEAQEQLNNLATQVTHFGTGEPIEEPVWSPDGTRIAFVLGASEGNRKIEVANSDGTSATAVVVAEHGEHPTWAPEGGKLAYSYGGKVFVKNADGSGLATEVAGASGGEPTWSPDGSRIAFAQTAGFSAVNLGLIVPAGGTATTLTSGAQFLYPSWSASGGQVGYLVSGGGEDHHWRVANADGSGDHALVDVEDLSPGSPLSWSPDGSRVVYGAYDFSGGVDTNQVYMESTAGGGVATPLTADEGYETYPAWRPSPAASPPIFTPAPGPTGTPGPLPVTQPKPTTVWITKRIFVSKGPDYTVIIGSYGCGGPRCSVATEGNARAAQPAGFSLDHGRVELKSKARSIVVAKGKTTIPGGQSRPVKMTLTKAGAKLLDQRGSLAFAVTVTITSPGAKKIVEHRHVTVALKTPPKKHRRH
jgi:Tol biopolymer transport system component